MCACEPDFVCLTHRETRHDPYYFIEGDEPTARERQEAEVDRVWRESQGFGMTGRVW